MEAQKHYLMPAGTKKKILVAALAVMVLVLLAMWLYLPVYSSSQMQPGEERKSFFLVLTVVFAVMTLGLYTFLWFLRKRFIARREYANAQNIEMMLGFESFTPLVFGFVHYVFFGMVEYAAAFFLVGLAMWAYAYRLAGKQAAEESMREKGYY